MKKFWTLLLAVALAVLCLIPLQTHAAEKTVRDSGTCGENVTWTLYDDNSLVFSGTGAMEDYSFDYRAPWHDQYRGSILSVEFENGITHIGAYAFHECRKIKSVTLGTGITSIGTMAFFGLNAITDLYITDASAWCKIEFMDATSYPNRSMGTKVHVLDADGAEVTELVLDDSVRKIHSGAFQKSILTSVVIPEGVTEIAGGAFTDCTGLKSVVIPDSVTTLANAIFRNCTGLQSVSFGKGITQMGSAIFDGCYNLKDVYIKDPTAWCNINFANNSADFLTERTTPHIVDDNGNEVKDIVLGDTVRSIPYYAFRGSMITSIVLPDSLHTIGYGAFQDAKSLQAITIPDSVTTISGYAFRDCDAMQTVHIGAGVTQMGEGAFYYCDNLKTITIAQGTTVIGVSAFGGNANLTTVVIPESVQSIGKRAFSACGALEEINLGEDLKFIGEEAFTGCKKISSIVIPKNVQSIATRVFTECDNLARIDVDGENAYYSSDALGVLFDKQKTKVVCAPAKLAGSYTVPETVTEIGQDAFYRCESLTEIVLPAGLKTIGSYAFRLCESLEEIILPEGLKTLGNSAFMACTNLKKAVIPGTVRDIGNSAFQDCGNLQTVEIGLGVLTIGDDAFQSSGLRSVVLPNSVSKIGQTAFFNCKNLSVAYVGKGVTTISYTAFAEIPNLKVFFEGRGPDISVNIFRDSVVTAYYPTNDITWEDEVRNGYGGTVSWVPLDMTKSMGWISATTTLGGNIGLNFYVTLSERLTHDDTTVMRFECNGQTIDVPLAQAVVTTGSNGQTQYRFTCPLNAKNMADTVTASVMTAQGSVGDAKGLAVMTYCNYMIQNSNDAELVRLMKAMLNYGAAAQILFNYNTDNLANASLSEADKQLADVDASAYAHSVTGTEEGIQVYNATLLLETETSIRIYFKLTGSKTIDQYTFMVDGEVVQAKPNGSQYYVEIPNIAAQHLDEMHTITVGGITIRYGGLSYVNQVIQNKESLSEALVNAVKTLFAYNKMAEAYFN